ncbi:DUF2946 family protein [Variovorax paradoxus]|nr:DUF2946 family protein [Variovorax paradoxus]MBT2304988.1 DUF2946 family protein [Variovorax paradoxus]
MLLRRLLIRLLLLAVFFNTVIGMPAHEAEHLQQTAAAVTALSAQPADEDADASEHGNEANGACAWCLAFAHLGIAPTSLPAVHALAVQAGLPRPQAPGTFVPSPGRCPFASRDPPHAVS